MSKIPIILFLCVFICGTARAQDEFSGVRCNADVPKALVGKSSSNGRVIVIEGRHKDLGLKNLGGDEISDHLFLESWSICGAEFDLLVNKKSRLIRDVVALPTHSVRSPMSMGPCQTDHKKLTEAVIAVLDNSTGYRARDSSNNNVLLKATVAWKIDERTERFAALSPVGLSCSVTGIITKDGGA